jgi:hypothetical protein
MKLICFQILVILFILSLGHGSHTDAHDTYLIDAEIATSTVYLVNESENTLLFKGAEMVILGYNSELNRQLIFNLYLKKGAEGSYKTSEEEVFLRQSPKATGIELTERTQNLQLLSANFISVPLQQGLLSLNKSDSALKSADYCYFMAVENSSVHKNEAKHVYNHYCLHVVFKQTLTSEQRQRFSHVFETLKYLEIDEKIQALDSISKLDRFSPNRTELTNGFVYEVMPQVLNITNKSSLVANKNINGLKSAAQEYIRLLEDQKSMFMVKKAKGFLLASDNQN